MIAFKETVNVTLIEVGDYISVNTGYRPLDDEWVEVKSVLIGVDIFQNECRSFVFYSNAMGGEGILQRR